MWDNLEFEQEITLENLLVLFIFCNQTDTYCLTFVRVFRNELCRKSGIAWTVNYMLAVNEEDSLRV